MRLKSLMIAVTLLGGFSSQAGETSSADNGDRGRVLYTAKCAKCHEVYKPSDYSDTEWTKWMQKMKKKSKLNASDYEEVFAYTQKLRGQ